MDNLDHATVRALTENGDIPYRRYLEIVAERGWQPDPRLAACAADLAGTAITDADLYA